MNAPDKELPPAPEAPASSSPEPDPPPAPVSSHHGMIGRIRNYFLTGLILVGPVYITLNLTWWFITWVDELVRPLIPIAYRPETYLPIKVPGQSKAAYGAAPTGVAVDEKAGIAYVALYNSNAIAVVDIAKGKVNGMIPVAYAPGSVALDSNDGVLIVANDKGVGTLRRFVGTFAKLDVG